MSKKEKKPPNREDVLVGENLAILRGSMSQAELANKMRTFTGRAWSQTTVWMVEKGERPLRLNEAKDLAHILGASLEDFFTRENEQIVSALDGLYIESLENWNSAIEWVLASLDSSHRFEMKIDKAIEQGVLTELDRKAQEGHLQNLRGIRSTVAKALAGKPVDMSGFSFASNTETANDLMKHFQGTELEDVAYSTLYSES